VRNQLRTQFADKPVAFIAISSGNSKSDIAGYAKETKFEWPILVDERRETESQYGFKISLQNIMQWVMYDPEGNRVQGNIVQEINSLLPKTTWLFDGITIPEKLKPIAHDIEFGVFEPSIAELALIAQKGSKDLQEPAKAMFEKIKGMATQGLEKAKGLEGEGKKYAAYVEYARVGSWFRHTEFEKTATTAMADLKKDKEVQEEVAAKQILDQAKALLASSKKSDRESAPALLALLQKKYPNTEAAKEAAKLK
jgi:hypothetical protein